MISKLNITRLVLSSISVETWLNITTKDNVSKTTLSIRQRYDTILFLNEHSRAVFMNVKEWKWLKDVFKRSLQSAQNYRTSYDKRVLQDVLEVPIKNQKQRRVLSLSYHQSTSKSFPYSWTKWFVLVFNIQNARKKIIHTTKYWTGSPKVFYHDSKA